MSLKNKIKNGTKIGLVSLIGILPACEKNVTAPEIKEELNPTEFVLEYYSNKSRFLEVDSVKTSGENVVIYGKFLDWYIGHGDEFDHINIDIGDLDMDENTPTFDMGKIPYKPLLNVFYSMFSPTGGPEISYWYGGNVWDEVYNKVSGVSKSSEPFGKIVIGENKK